MIPDARRAGARAQNVECPGARENEMNIVLATLVVGCVAYLIIKKYKSQTTLFAGGILLMLLAYVLGYKTNFVPSKNSLGLPLFDIFEYISLLFSKDAAHLGLMIMAITGFAKYMDAIGASSTLVHLAMKPLGRLNAPYVVMSLSFLLCMFMALFISSASGLAMLMMVTVFPILTSLGVSRLGAASVVSTGHLLDIGPSSATTMLVAKTANVDVGVLFVDYQLETYIVTGLAAATAHYFWQRHLDRRDAASGRVEEPAAVEISDKDMAGVAPPGPTVFAILPMLPLFFLLGCGEYGFKSVKMTVVTAMLLSLSISMLFVLVHKRDLKHTFASAQAFFKGMGDQFTMTITLIVAGQTFAFGLQSIGAVADAVTASQNLGLSATLVLLLICAVIVMFSVVMGSGVAPMFAFSPLMPDIAKGMGGNLVEMLLAVQNSASLGRLLSPITAVIVAVAGLARLNPVDLVKRNSVPVLVSLIVSMICSLTFHSA